MTDFGAEHGMGSGRDGAEIAFVALGSNLGDRTGAFEGVIRAIERDPALEIEAASPVYETDPVGPGDQRPYLNAVVRLRTSLEPTELLDWLLDLERRLGRDRSEGAIRWGPRVIDLDVLFYGNLCIETERLVVPHPRIEERAFVLAPMADIAPDYVHPVLSRDIASLVASCKDLESIRPGPRPSGWPGTS
jgi:2-amino-4-hydroxy-6-hydroxymethyldihydropteridine diphosphokinase